MHKLSERSEGSEQDIVKLVNSVREDDCESSFIKLRDYLQQYISMFAKKYRIPGCDYDEIEQECLFALRYKAIEDFNQARGKFKTFAILCIKRHLFSLIKANNQQKRTVLNTSLSLEEDRSDDGDNLSLVSLIPQDGETIIDQVSRRESYFVQENILVSKLSGLEEEVYKLYMQQMSYEEIVIELSKIFPDRECNIKTVDNSLMRLKSKAHDLRKKRGFEEI